MNYLKVIFFLLFIMLSFFSCKHNQGASNPYYHSKKPKISEEIATEHAKNEKKVKKIGRRQLKKNRKELYGR